MFSAASKMWSMSNVKATQINRIISLNAIKKVSRFVVLYYSI